MELNMIHEGDNLEILKSLDDDSVDLIYMDPPYNSGRDFGEFDDRYDTMDEYVEYMRERIQVCSQVLKSGGSFYLHVDSNSSHYLKIACDQELQQNYLCEIVWVRTTANHADSKSFGKVSDRILLYGERINKDAVKIPLRDEYVQTTYKHEDERGFYRTISLTAESLGGRGYKYEYKGHVREWKYPEHSMQKLESDNMIHIPAKPGGLPSKKLHLADNNGMHLGDVWTDIKCLGPVAKERVNYPTQKPIKLLERIILASSNEGDTVLDPFCGSGTTLAAAKALNRNYIGIDVNPEAVRIAIERLTEIESSDDLPPENPFLKKR